VRIPVWFVAALIIVVSLLTGVIVGVAVDQHMRIPRMIFSRGMGHQTFAPHRLEHELGLSPAQSAAVDSITHHRMAQRDSLFANMRPALRQLLDSTRSDIERVLTPDQRAKFETMRYRSGPPQASVR
jgi:Spy/CpxP family protein refolding chaperone